MKVGDAYVWPGCFTIDLHGQPSRHLKLFIVMPFGRLWPRPVVGVNVSKLPIGEGISLENVRKWRVLARLN